MEFKYLKSHVSNRGVPPDWFLLGQIEWAKKADAEIFAPRPNPNAPNGRDPDVYALLKPILGPWSSLLHRRAAMCELQRVHAGLESSWKQHEGKDPGNHNPDPKSWETGLFQVSFDSTESNKSLMTFAVSHGIGTPGSFMTQMKLELDLAFEYYARLVRFSYQWAGPLKRHEVDQWLSPSAVLEYESLLV
jgi:hypothetical protein